MKAITLSECRIETSKEVKYLGITLDSKHSLKTHVDNTIAKCTRALFRFISLHIVIEMKQKATLIRIEGAGNDCNLTSKDAETLKGDILCQLSIGSLRTSALISVIKTVGHPWGKYTL